MKHSTVSKVKPYLCISSLATCGRYGGSWEVVRGTRPSSDETTSPHHFNNVDNFIFISRVYTLLFNNEREKST